MTVKDRESLVETVENRQGQHDKRFDKIESQSSSSFPIADAYPDTYNAPDSIPLPRPTHYPRHIEPQDRQPHYQASRHTYTYDPIRKVKLDAPEFDVFDGPMLMKKRGFLFLGLSLDLSPISSVTLEFIPYIL
ncbi:LOW QUALITY PROTEIN: hypothetical protein TorRG33x02_332820 [Trema orientale]|uniref:Uncharacterized protein n=1 Tax=Trema orientale TaxID=63057 RepID=A0A2P5B4Z1_TREOI|nr:LOW QUALITY PROTEIN: hypothetical protein TorRG33x02_332820 [Trema orientale]